MNEKKRKEKNEKMINVGEKSTENVKIKRIIEKKFLKKKKNSDTMIFDIVGVKNSSAVILIKYYIDDTMTISNNFTKFSFKFENFLREKSALQTQKKEQKKKKERKRTKVSRRRRRKQINEFLFFV